ncbi:MAG: hypothetical protein RR440_01680 [Erysipelotrichaceae bacterium]
MENREILVKLAKRSDQIKKEQIEGCFDSLSLNYLRALLLIDNDNRKGFTDFIKKYENVLSFYDKYRKLALALLVGLIIGLSLAYFPIKMLQEETMKAYEAESVAKEAYSQLTQSISASDDE